MKSEWISVGDRLPTEKDGDRWGNVLWGNTWELHSLSLAPWYNPEAVIVYSHWMALPDPPKEQDGN